MRWVEILLIVHAYDYVNQTNEVEKWCLWVGGNKSVPIHNYVDISAWTSTKILKYYSYFTFERGVDDDTGEVRSEIGLRQGASHTTCFHPCIKRNST